MGRVTNICRGWCRSNGNVWAMKCAWANCGGCSECAKQAWKMVDSNGVCDVSSGELYIKDSPGKLPNLKACQDTCEDNPTCRSITYYGGGWCSHFSTECTAV